MSRRAPSDTFTRFTATAPHASQKPASASTFSYQHPNSAAPSLLGQAGLDGETPAQKVARLRAAARAQKELASLSPIDRMLDRGRRLADSAHRITTYTLIGLTGVATIIAVYGLTDLIAHNRRQKRAWIEREMGRLQDAQQAFLRGEANAEQLHLLEQERAGEEMAANAKKEKDRRKSASYWSQLKGLVGKGTAAGEMGREEPRAIEARQVRKGGRERLLEDPWIEGEVKPMAVAPSGIKGVGVDSKGRPVPAGSVERVAKQIGEERRVGEKEVTDRTGITGGPLDVLAGNIAAAVGPSSHGRGWLSWVRSDRS